MYHFCTNRNRKKRRRISPSPLGNALFLAFFLLEVPLQQALERLAVARFVAGHFMRQAASVLPLGGAGKRKTPTKASISERK